MRIDLDAITEPREFTSTVCIVGAGIAGLLLARNLAVRGIDVTLIEGGGPTLETRSQEMYSAEMEGRHHDGTTRGRFRVFGGSSTRWGGQLLPYTQDIFHPPNGVPSAGWPVSSEDLQSYYPEVLGVMHVREDFPDSELCDLPEAKQRNRPDIQIRFSKWAPFSKRNLANTIGRECLASEQIACFLHANATCLEADRFSARIDRAIVKNYRGTTFHFRAAHFVICTGTIESSRLLLASCQNAARGIGNLSDNVGRYFHDHISVAAAPIAGRASREFVRLFSPRLAGSTLFTPKLEASPALRSKHRLLAVMAHFAIEEPEGTGVAAVRNVLQSIQRRENSRQLIKVISALPRNLKEVARLLWFANVKKQRAISKDAKVTLRLDCEQKPNPYSRIRLSTERDALGMPKAIVDWRISGEEQRTIRCFATVVDRYLNEIGVGPLEWRPELAKTDDSWLSLTSDTFHAMGGTRMGTDPKSSVVDPNLRVHGVPNLFVASCSVFPGGGSSNPTFTLMALTLRLGEYLSNIATQRLPAISVHQKIAS